MGMMITGWTDKEGNSLSYEPLGVFPSPNGKEWSTKPYTKEQKKLATAENRFIKIFNKITNHLSRTDRSINEELSLIKEKKSTLPKYCRVFLLSTQ